MCTNKATGIFDLKNDNYIIYTEDQFQSYSIQFKQEN